MWVNFQRQQRKKTALSDEQISLLDKLSFTWRQRERESWEDRLAEVVAFKEEYGHCDIPLTLKNPPKLSAFVNNSRSQRNNGTLTVERIAKLDAVGFIWINGSRIDGDGMNTAWKERFDELLEYKKIHGDCIVPTRSKENPQLGNWVNQQRILKKNGTLHSERIRLLDEAGFRWAGTGSGIAKNGQADSWSEIFTELLQYKQTYGNCNVPARFAENPFLGGWVVRQRQLKKSEKLDSERAHLLDSAGFEWELRRSDKISP